jgi:dUTP pyrophosphatase
VKVDLKILNPRIGRDLPLPKRATAGSAGSISGVPRRPLELAPGHRADSTVSRFIGDPKLTALIIPRSGLGHKHGIVLGNWSGSSTPTTRASS